MYIFILTIIACAHSKNRLVETTNNLTNLVDGYVSNQKTQSELG